MSASGYIEMSALSSFFQGFPAEDATDDGLIRDNYADFGPTLAYEKLAEPHDVVIAIETVHQLIVRAELWPPANAYAEDPAAARSSRLRCLALLSSRP